MQMHLLSNHFRGKLIAYEFDTIEVNGGRSSKRKNQQIEAQHAPILLLWSHPGVLSPSIGIVVIR